MIQILVYSRQAEKQLNNSIEMICEKLNEIGFNCHQTHSTHLARLLMNPYQVVHLFIEKLPLSLHEIFFISFAKTLGKGTLLSLFNSEPKLSKPLISLFCPDSLTVSQTNYLKYYRDWLCPKSLLPLLPKIKTSKAITSKAKGNWPFLIPLEKDLEEAFQFITLRETYFDARALLKDQSSTQLRKKWNQYLQTKKISSEYHLILSDEKVEELLQDQQLQVVLASPHLAHTEFTEWLQKTLSRDQFILLNDFQATGFSQAWTSKVNCEVLSTQAWPKGLNEYAENSPKISETTSRFKQSELVEPLINELSRLYTKILRQKTTLISEDSIKVKP